jgi:hypothetical protein
MDITLSGKLYVHFIKSVFESNKKIGIQIIIDNYKSNNIIIDGLKRLKLLDKNIIFIENENVKIPVRIYEHKYICNIILTINSQNKIILNELKDIVYDKIDKIIDNKLYIPTYSYGKKKTVEKIMDIINNKI